MRDFLLMLLSVIIFGCIGGKNKENQESNVNIDLGIRKLSKKPEIDIMNKECYVIIKSIGFYDSKYYIVADVVEFVRGEEAVKFAKKEGITLINDEDTLTGMPHAYYISNVNKKVKTFQLTENVKIKIKSVPEEKGMNSEINREASISSLNYNLKFNKIWKLDVKDGVVQSVADEYLKKQ